MNHVFAGIAVSDLDAGLAWWERLLGRPPDMRPNDDEACWQLTDSGWIYVVRDAERAGKGLVTVLVDDLDEHLAGVGERGIEVGPIKEIPGAVRSVWISDPEGNRIQFGEPQQA
jgi:predicted enzyme related to lactoylglutathione lyase